MSGNKIAGRVEHEEFRKQVIQKYHNEFGCGKEMSLEEIGHEFDLTIGKSGYEEFVRVEKLCERDGRPFDALKHATAQMKFVI